MAESGIPETRGLGEGPTAASRGWKQDGPGRSERVTHYYDPCWRKSGIYWSFGSQITDSLLCANRTAVSKGGIVVKVLGIEGGALNYTKSH